MSLPTRYEHLLRRWRVSHYQHRQANDARRLERSVLTARMADEHLWGVQTHARG